MKLHFIRRDYGWCEAACHLMRAVIGSPRNVIRVVRKCMDGEERLTKYDFHWLWDE